MTVRDDTPILVGWRPYAALAAVVFAVYVRTIFFGFTYLDDNALILESQRFLTDFGNLLRAFATDVFRDASQAYYRPVFTVLLMIVAHAAGAAAWAYHLLALVVHAAACCLLFAFLVTLGARRLPAFFVALLFAVHPALAHAVAWVPGINDTLLFLFVLASFLCFLSYAEAGKPAMLGAHALLFALALFTKESALALPLLCLAALPLLHRGRLLSRRTLACGLLWVAVAAAWWVARGAAFAHPIPYAPASIAAWLAGNGPAVLLVLGKILLPASLAALPTLEDSSLLVGAAALAVATVALLLSKGRDSRHVLFGLLWFLLFLAPSLVRPDPTAVADFMEHRAYLPAVGILLVLLEIGPIKHLGEGRRALPGVAIAATVIAAFAVMNVAHLGAFADRMSFWRSAAASSPHHPLAQRNLGAMLYLDGRLDEALPLFRRALELDPREPMAHMNIGLVYASRGMIAEAEAEYLEEIRINPRFPLAYENLALLYERTGRTAAAEAMRRKAAELNPEWGRIP